MLRALSWIRRWSGVALAGGCVFYVMSAAAQEMTLSRPVAGSPTGSKESFHFADADDVAKVSAGKVIYRQRCASCHGRRLQGQPLWQLEDRFKGRRAPAHDQSGHTWAHSDEELFRITRDSRFSSTPASEVSYMPGFRDVLNDEQIVSVIAFIKSRWPIGLRISQAMLNPDRAGMPAVGADVEWTFPPTCTSSLQRWKSTSR